VATDCDAVSEESVSRGRIFRFLHIAESKNDEKSVAQSCISQLDILATNSDFLLPEGKA